MLPAHPQRPLVFNVPSGSRGLDELVDLPPGLEPVDVAGKGPFMHFAKELDGFRFVARFAWIFGRDNLLDINRHDQPICLDQSRPLHSLAWYTHASALFGGVVVIQHDTPFKGPFRGMFADDIAAAINKPADFGKREGTAMRSLWLLHRRSWIMRS